MAREDEAIRERQRRSLRRAARRARGRVRRLRPGAPAVDGGRAGAGADRRLRLPRPGAGQAPGRRRAGRCAARRAIRTDAEDIEAAGLEAAVADPDRAASILDHVGDVTLVFWLLGSARGRAGGGRRDPRPAARAAAGEAGRHAGARLRLRGGGTRAAAGTSSAARAIVREAAERWRIPVEVGRPATPATGRRGSRRCWPPPSG